MYFIDNLPKIKYSLAHRKAFRSTEKQLLGYNTMRSLFHDMDKLFYLCFMPKEKASKLHRKYSRHHNKARTTADYIQMVIDWECARFTKPDKPLNARETLYKFYPELVSKIEPILRMLGL